MSTATTVPETRDSDGEAALRTLRRGGPRLLADAFTRLRWADGFSHSRAVGFQLTLTMLPALIAVQGLAQLIGATSFRRVVQDSINGLLPGPTAKVLKAASAQGAHAGRSGAVLALCLGLVAALVSGATTMGQVERGSNRIYGVEKDRQSLHKYGLATLLALSAGVLGALAFGLVVAGKALAASVHAGPIFGALRWPLAVLLAVAGFTVLFRVAPNRRQPRLSWLAFGAVVSVILWSLFTLLLSLYVGSARVGATYGALVGVISLLLWAQLTAMAMLYGVALTAQLEAVRAGVPEPVSSAGTNRRPAQRTARARSGAARTRKRASARTS